jgi:hypothetical protein
VAVASAAAAFRFLICEISKVREELLPNQVSLNWIWRFLTGHSSGPRVKDTTTTGQEQVEHWIGIGKGRHIRWK